jgi:hypothetical protein
MKEYDEYDEYSYVTYSGWETVNQDPEYNSWAKVAIENTVFVLHGLNGAKAKVMFVDQGRFRGRATYNGSIIINVKACKNEDINSIKGLLAHEISHNHEMFAVQSFGSWYGKMRMEKLLDTKPGDLWHEKQNQHSNLMVYYNRRRTEARANMDEIIAGHPSAVERLKSVFENDTGGEHFDRYLTDWIKVHFNRFDLVGPEYIQLMKQRLWQYIIETRGVLAIDETLPAEVKKIIKRINDKYHKESYSLGDLRAQQKKIKEVAFL